MFLQSNVGPLSEKVGFFNTITQAWHSNDMHVTVHLNAGQTVWCEVLNTQGNMSLYQDKSSFSGHLVYAD